MYYVIVRNGKILTRNNKVLVRDTSPAPVETYFLQESSGDILSTVDDYLLEFTPSQTKSSISDNK